MGKKILLATEENWDDFYQLEQKLGHSFQLVKLLNDDKTRHLGHAVSADIAIISHSFSNFHGLDFVCELSEFSPKIPIIFLAEKPTQEIIIQAFRAGADDFLSMPCKQNDLLDAIQRVEHKAKRNVIRRSLASNSKLIKQCTSRLKSFLKTNQHSKITNSTNSKDDDKNSQDHRQKSHASNDGSHPVLHIQFLGQFIVKLNGIDVTKWSGKKAKQLFAYLAYATKPVHKEKLMEVFWSSVSPESARNCLNVTLYQVREALRLDNDSTNIVIFDAEQYGINPDIQISSDVQSFRHHLKNGLRLENEQKIEEALAEYAITISYYTADFLEEMLYDSWTELERENLKETYLLVLNKMSHYYSLDGKPNEAIDMCHKILQKDNCREDIHRRLMRCYNRIGQRDQAVKQYRKCRSILLAELDVEPSKDTRQLYEQIKNFPNA